MKLIDKIQISPVFLIIGLFFSPLVVPASNIFSPSDSLSKVKTIALLSTASAGTVTVYSLLSKQWYGDYERVGFKWFNDGEEWLQIDKFGHGLTAYYGGYYGYNSLKWAGVGEKYCVWVGGMYGFTFLLGTEIMDGFSSGWGASPGDLLSNGIGTSLFIAQQLLFKKQYVIPKFSYWPTKFAEYRPSLLGDNHWNRWLKDYNGQNYWCSFSSSIINKKMPRWLCLSVGYGANGMLGGERNPELNSKGEILPDFKRRREYYLSLDIDFNQINTKSPFLNTILKGLSFVKIPFPGLMYSDGKLRGKVLAY